MVIVVAVGGPLDGIILVGILDKRGNAMGRAIDITGQGFGRLVALLMTGHSQSGNALWLCQCDCGNQIVTDSNHLRHGLVRSCGCLRRERSRENILTNPKTLARMKCGSPTPYDPEKPIRVNHL